MLTKAIVAFTAVWIILVFLSERTCAQAVENPGYIQGKITDASNGMVLPYAHIYNKGISKGTVSDIHGAFELPFVSKFDTVIISYMGYETRRLNLEKLLNNPEIKLSPKPALLNQVTILADNTMLYHLMEKCRKNRLSEVQHAKTYYQLTTTVKGEKTEFIEGYYNGTTKGYSIENLELKNGRLYLRKLDNTYFVSTESSRIFTNHSIISPNEYFPHSPLEYNSKQLKKAYELRLVKRYKTAEKHTMYVIHFTPKQDAPAFFEGDVWIDSTLSVVGKISLNRANASRHPFDPIWSSDELTSVNLNITKTFEWVEGKIRIRQIDFLYDLNYSNRIGEEYLMQSKALLFPYDYESLFQLPLFEHSSSAHGDYQKISAVPYNSLFWQKTGDFRMNIGNVPEEFFQDSAMRETNLRLFTIHDVSRTGFFEHPYISWSEKRIGFKVPDENNSRYNGNLNYDLVAQIYMDVNLLDDSLSVLSATIFDPFLSFYNTEINERVNCFINIYFDIMEIERRKMVDEIHKKASTEREAVEIYTAMLKNAHKLTSDYFNEVRKGNNTVMLRKWNSYVSDQLGIDNMDLFGISEASN